jgi:hypothetical protein
MVYVAEAVALCVSPVASAIALMVTVEFTGTAVL